MAEDITGMYGMYARQISFKGMGKSGQKKLSESRVVIVGCGATGSLAAEIMVRSGVGKVRIIDRDIVELSNIQSQSLFHYGDIGKPKAVVAAGLLKSINPSVEIEAFAADLDVNNADLLDADAVLDCTDNFYTRFLINDYCRKHRLPWVYCGVAGSKGTVISFVPESYCFECVFGSLGTGAEGETCETEGVLSQAIHTAVAFQTSEAFKILLGKKPLLKMIRFDIWDFDFCAYDVKKRDGCRACRGLFAHLSGKAKITKLCGSGMYQIKKSFDFEKVKRNLSSSKDFVDMKVAFRCRDITVFPGRVLVRAKSESEAMGKFRQYIR